MSADCDLLMNTAIPPNSNDGDVEQDDAIIGVAFRYSALGFLALLLMVGGFFAVKWMMTPPPPVVQAPAIIDPIKTREEVPIALPQIPWSNITEVAGISFKHESGAAGEKLLPETMGGGCAFLDYDSDGDQDILLVNSRRWDWDTRPAPDKEPIHALYQNDGHGKFVDVTVDAGLNVSFYGMAVAVGDYDNDGDPDLCFTTVGQNHLFRNEKGRFSDITEGSGLAGSESDWGSSCGWFDYDNDGDLDLWVNRYVVWTPDIDRHQDFSLTGGERAYGRPTQFDATFPVLYRNNGDQTFADVSVEMGIQVTDSQTRKPSAKSLGLTFADVDHNGWIDVLVANDTVQNFLFLNREGKKFEEVGRLQGIAFSPEGTARAGMGIDVGMFRTGTDDCGVVVGNFANEMTALYVAPAGTASFTDEAVSTGLGPQTRLVLTFAVMFLDADLDGRLDLFCANGHLEEDIAKVQESQQYEQPAQLFWNAGASQATEFVPLSDQECGPDLFVPMVGRGAAFADIDNDGDLDILETACGQPPRLLRNDLPTGKHWMRFTLEGSTSNRDAIGAEVTLVAGGVKQSRMVMPTRSYQSQCEKTVSFGLGSIDKIDSVTIRWPGGQEQTVAAPAVDQVVRLSQPAKQ